MDVEKDRFKETRRTLEERGFTLYSVSMNSEGPQTLIMYNSEEKRFAFMVFDKASGFYLRQDVFLYMAESKTEVLGKKEVRPYTVAKDEQGMWRVVTK